MGRDKEEMPPPETEGAPLQPIIAGQLDLGPMFAFKTEELILTCS